MKVQEQATYEPQVPQCGIHGARDPAGKASLADSSWPQARHSCTGTPGAGSCPLKYKTGSACLAEPGQGRAMGQGRRGFCLDKEREGGADGVLRGH